MSKRESSPQATPPPADNVPKVPDKTASTADFGTDTSQTTLSDAEQILDTLVRMHPADAAQHLERLDLDYFDTLIAELGDKIRPQTLTELPPARQERALSALSNAAIANILAQLDSDDATALLSQAEDHRIPDILKAVAPKARAHLEDGLSYTANSAGRLMQREFVALPGFWTVAKALAHIKQRADDLPKVFYEVYVVDPIFHVKGVIQLSHLVTSTTDLTLNALAQPLISDIYVDQDQEDVAHQFRKYSLASAPVKDDAERLIGMITVDDMVHVLQEEHAEDLLALSNVTAQKKHGVWPAVRGRIPWLLFNLVTAIATSLVISLFEATLEAIVFLAVLMPIVAVIGGNAGNQTLAVTIRAMTEKSLHGPAALRAVRRELVVALIIGCILGVTLGAATYVWRGNFAIALLIGVSMQITIFWAGLLGILVPLGLRRLGADPAIASSVFVLSISDLIAFVSFLGLAAAFIL